MKLHNFFSIFVIITLSFSSLILANQYDIDQEKSFIHFKIKHLKKFTVNGTFKHFNGEAIIKNSKLISGSGEITVKSLFSGNKTRDRHLQSKDFFHETKLPLITFQSQSSTYNIEAKTPILNGELTIAGVKQPIEIPINMTATNNSDYIVKSTLTINRLDFGMKKHKRMVGKTVNVDLLFYFSPSKENLLPTKK